MISDIVENQEPTKNMEKVTKSAFLNQQQFGLLFNYFRFTLQNFHSVNITKRLSLQFKNWFRQYNLQVELSNMKQQNISAQENQSAEVLADEHVLIEESTDTWRNS